MREGPVDQQRHETTHLVPQAHLRPLFSMPLHFVYFHFNIHHIVLLFIYCRLSFLFLGSEITVPDPSSRERHYRGIQLLSRLHINAAHEYAMMILFQADSVFSCAMLLHLLSLLEMPSICLSVWQTPTHL